MASTSKAPTPTSTSDTNFLPRSSCGLAGEYPCSACREALALEDQIIETEKLLAHLKARRLPLRSKINTYHDPVAGRLPPELLSNIFMHVLAASSSINQENEVEQVAVYDGDDGQQSQQIPPLNSVDDLKLAKDYKVCEPLQLGWICRSWRNAAWSTPQIWTRITLNFEDDTVSIDERHVELLQACLDRSASLPLHLTIYVDIPKDDEDLNPNILPMFDLLLRHSSRWVDLDVDITETSLQLLHFNPEVRPKLKKLGLTCILPVPDISINAIWDDLTHITLIGIPLKQVDVDLSHLTHATLYSFEMADCLELLFRIPRLVYFMSEHMEFNEDPLPFIPHLLTHHRLRYLNLTFGDEHVASALLPRIAFTALEELTLEIRGGKSIGQAFGPEFKKSLATVKRMELHDGFCGDDKVHLSILEHATALKYLSLDLSEPIWDVPIDPLLRLLSLDNSTPQNAMKHPNFLPKLEEVRILDPRARFSWDLIPRIFRSTPTLPIELGLSRPLRSLHIQYGYSNTDIPPYLDHRLLHHLLTVRYDRMTEVAPGRIEFEPSISFHRLPQSEEGNHMDV